MAMFCSTVRCKEEYEMIVGTSTSCSAVCGGRAKSTIRRRALSSEIFGTSITGSAPASTSKFCMNSTTCSPPHLRHRSIENLNRHKGLDNLLRGVPLDPRLWPHLNKRCRPGGKHIPLVEQVKVHRACRPGRRSLLARGGVHLALLFPGPGHALSPWGGVVLTLGQGHCDAQTFVP